MKNKKTITEEEVQQALNKFVKDGGLIKQLPDQVTPINTLVGARWGVYEIVSDTASSSAAAAR